MKDKWKKMAVIGGIAGVLSLGGVIAFLTDYDSTVNKFTVGKVDIKLEEPDWVPDDHTKVEPGEEMEKDPQIKNTGVNAAFVYLEVSIPMAEVIAADVDGNRLDRENQELFSFEPGEDWTKIDQKDIDTYRVYTYSYNEILQPEKTTAPLFEKVKFLNIVEGQMDGQQVNIPIRAYAIQTVNTGDGKESIPEQAKAAYLKYINQNEGQEGAVTK